MDFNSIYLFHSNYTGKMGLILLTFLYFSLVVIHFFLTVPPFVGERNNARCKDAGACGRISLSSIAHPSSFCRLHNVLCTSCVCHHCELHTSLEAVAPANW